jgi:TatD DNase family protein
MAVELFDTHCHIHEADVHYQDATESHNKWLKNKVTDADALVAEANKAGVTRLVCIGTTLEDSQHAIAFAARHEQVWATIAIHPHEAAHYTGNQERLQTFASLVTKDKVVAVGECGLDYYYEHSPRAKQIEILEFQLDLAQRHNLPLSFHVRDAFDDFWPVFDNFKGLSGVIHSFTATTKELDQILSRDLYVGINGIMTFTTDEKQLEAARAVPLGRLVLETDAPYLTPVPFRGKVCMPSHLVATAEFMGKLRSEDLQTLAKATTKNALKLYRL